MDEGRLEQRAGMVLCDKPRRGFERCGQIRLGLDHDAIWVERASHLTHFVASGEQRFGAIAPLGELAAMDLEPEAARALLESRNAGFGEPRHQAAAA